MILVTGGDGQLGNELKLILKASDAIFTDYTECDITNLEQIENIVSKNKISAIINCAAYTAVDKAEIESDRAYKINEQGAINLAKVSKEYGIKLIHISTDYVFDGKHYKPILETDITNPESVYGKSKLSGEMYILKTGITGIIIRTSWLYSTFGNNFFKSMIKYGKDKNELSVVFDQIGTPTYAADLAQTIIKIHHQIEHRTCEIYHYSNEGVASWYDFAKEIMELNNIKCHIIGIESSEYPSPAKRPYYSVLNKNKIKNKFKITIPHWKDGLKRCSEIFAKDPL